MYNEDELISVSALQHTMFCERQCALIHLEQLWEENRYTAEGQELHERVDEEHHEKRRLKRTEYAMSIRSLNYGLIGKCDVVDFVLKPGGGYQSIVPVEFKRGKQKESDVDRVQLCAQALCLEEMFGISVPFGEFFYLQEHRRSSTDFTSVLRDQTLLIIQRTQDILRGQLTPQAVYRKETCDRCSLIELCMPKVVAQGGKRVDQYIAAQINLTRKGCDTCGNS